MEVSEVREGLRPYCTMCEKDLKKEALVYDDEVYCSVDCIEENNAHLKEYDKDKIGKMVI